MHSIALTIPSSHVTEQQALPVTGRALLLFVTMVIVGVYAMPIQQTWLVSAQDHYAATSDDMEAAATSGNQTRQASFILLGLLGVLGLMASERTSLRTSGALGLFCIAYVAWCGASVAWAVEPAISVRRFAVMMCEAVAALAFARYVSPKQMVVITLACTLTWLGLGVLAELSLGTFHPSDGDYRFSGIFHPNEMGVQCSILIIAAVYLFPLRAPLPTAGDWRGHRRWIRLLDSYWFANRDRGNRSVSHCGLAQRGTGSPPTHAHRRVRVARGSDGYGLSDQTDELAGQHHGDRSSRQRRCVVDRTNSFVGRARYVHCRKTVDRAWIRCLLDSRSYPNAI